MPLAAMPKAFGIEDLCKGFFPHLFNMRENQSYKGPFPEAFSYSPSTMKPAEYDKFMMWFRNQHEKVIFLKSFPICRNILFRNSTSKKKFCVIVKTM